MIIKRVAVGNEMEAYIENNLAENTNVIFSDDNNKGKTIVIQSVMYCLGNEPAFPTSFEYKKYYYYLEFDHNSCSYIVCRKGNTFIFLNGSSLMLFDNISEMKRFWTKEIYPLPTIIKNGMLRIVDPVLFLQLFFIGQDKKDTANIANKGFYNKNDFINMIFAYYGLGTKGLSPEEISHKKDCIRDLKAEKKTLQTQHKLLRSKDTSSAYLSQYNDKQLLEAKLKNIEIVKERIAALRKERNSALTRKTKYEIAEKELKSLNRTMKTGELRCLDCKSTHIGFTTEPKSSYSFDVSTPDIRNQIIGSINEKIASYAEEAERLTHEINKQQEQLQNLFSEEDVTLESIIMHKNSFLDAVGVDDRLQEIDKEIDQFIDAMRANDTSNSTQEEEQKTLMASILSEMNSAYKNIDPNGRLEFSGLFTKGDQVYSGSEATEFHLSKMYAYAKVLNHPCPIIVDSFRAEDLSTEREKTVIDLFSSLQRQVILTTTLKDEEIGKYQNERTINSIDYSQHAPSKILNDEHVFEFAKLLERLSVSL